MIGTLCDSTPSTTMSIAGKNSKKNINPKLKLAPICAPQVFLKRAVDFFSAVNGPMFSMTRIGSTKKLTNVHAVPSSDATNLPIFSFLSSMIRRIKPTVAETSAQPKMAWMRENAIEKPSPTVGSCPRIRAKDVSE